MQTWRRNFYTLWVAELVAVAGFTVVIPFLPYYVQELGVTELKQVEFWSGLLFASHAVAMAILSPITLRVRSIVSINNLARFSRLPPYLSVRWLIEADRKSAINPE